MKKEEEINLRILELKYQRYVSRAHTTFEVGASLIPTIILGMAGVFFALLQAKVVFLNKFYITQFSLPTMFVSVVAGATGLMIIFNSRKHRNNIETLIKNIRDKNGTLNG